jgi:YfiH family protein
VHAVCTTRSGGTSLPPFDSFNLGDHVGDSATAVATNRALLQGAMGVPTVFLSQVHGASVATLSEATVHAVIADACVTTQSRLACSVMVADCLPVLLCDQRGSVVAAAHAGWRGLAGHGGQGVLETVIAAVRASNKDEPDSLLLAWLGPCIGPRAFHVGADVRDAFVADRPDAATMFRRQAGDTWLADLPGLARLRLAALGVTRIYGNDGSDEWCTFSKPSRFFSHRRDSVSGRMAACIWLE